MSVNEIGSQMNARESQIPYGVPDEVFLNILVFLPLLSLMQAQLVCKGWYARANDEQVWHHFCLKYTSRKEDNETWRDVALAYYSALKSFRQGDVLNRQPAVGTHSIQPMDHCPVIFNESLLADRLCMKQLNLQDYTKEIALWDLETNQELHAFKVDNFSIKDIRLEGRSLMIRSENFILRYNMNGPVEKWTWNSSDERYVTIHKNWHILNFCSNERTNLYVTKADAYPSEEGKSPEDCLLLPHSARIERKMAVIDHYLISRAGGNAHIWDLESGMLLDQFKHWRPRNPCSIDPLREHLFELNDNLRIYAISSFRMSLIQVYDLNEKKISFELQFSNKIFCMTLNKNVLAIIVLIPGVDEDKNRLELHLIDLSKQLFSSYPLKDLVEENVGLKLERMNINEYGTLNIRLSWVGHILYMILFEKGEVIIKKWNFSKGASKPKQSEPNQIKLN